MGRFGPPQALAPLRYNGDNTAVTILGTVFHFVIAVLVILVVAWIAWELLQRLDRWRSHRVGAPGAALAELDMLYARGEVSREDFLIRRADLGTPAAHVPLPPAV